MSYQDMFGVTNIVDRVADNLSISRDQHAGRIDAENEVCAVLLYVPHMDYKEHYHIVLRRDEAKTLHEWLTAYLADSERKEP